LDPTGELTLKKGRGEKGEEGNEDEWDPEKFCGEN